MRKTRIKGKELLYNNIFKVFAKTLEEQLGSDDCSDVIIKEARQFLKDFAYLAQSEAALEAVRTVSGAAPVFPFSTEKKA